MTLRVISFGAGVQTTALAILTAEGKVPNPATHLVFADTKGEHDATYAYIRDHLRPWLARAGNGLVLDERCREPGLYQYAYDRQMVPSINTRWCTSRFKIDVVNAWAKEHGATRADPVELQIGISVDEAKRARPNKRQRKYVTRRYPLLELGISRADCARIIAEAGLPVPPKSGCWYCPYQRKRQWVELKLHEPEKAELALALEDNARLRNPRDLLGGYFKLRDLIGGGTQLDFDSVLENDEGCTQGYCFV